MGDKVPSAYGDHYYLAYEKLTTLMYLKISISDFLTLFCARTRGPFYERFPSLPLFSAFLFATVVATLVAVNAGKLRKMAPRARTTETRYRGPRRIPPHPNPSYPIPPHPNADIYDGTYPMEHISVQAACFVWGWNIFFFLVQDVCKLAIYATFGGSSFCTMPHQPISRHE